MLIRKLMQPPISCPEPQHQEVTPPDILLPAQDSRNLPTWAESERAPAQDVEPWAAACEAKSSPGQGAAGEEKRIASPPAIQISTSALEAHPSTRPSNWLAPQTNWLSSDSRPRSGRSNGLVIKQPWDEELEGLGCGGGNLANGTDSRHVDTTPAHLSALRSRVARLMEGEIPDQISPASKKLPQKPAHKKPVAPPPEPSDSLKMPTNSLKRDPPGNGVGESQQTGLQFSRGAASPRTLQVTSDDGSQKSPDGRQAKATAPSTPPGNPRRSRHSDVPDLTHGSGGSEDQNSPEGRDGDTVPNFTSPALAVMLPRTPPERGSRSWGEVRRPRPHARGSVRGEV